MPGRRDSEEKADATTTIAKHWRGLTRRVSVLRKWSWLVSNNFEQKDEEKMLDLGLFVQSIEHELAAEPSLRRRSTSGVQLLTRGASAIGADAGSSNAPVPQRDITLSFPLREPDVLEMIASFSRGQRVDPSSVAKLLERQIELLRPLPNVVRYEVPAGQVSRLAPPNFPGDHMDADRSGPSHHRSLPD